MTEKSSAPEGEMPTLPQALLDLIGEYGMASIDGASGVERIHRWELLIDGIKDYAREYAATSAAQAAGGGAVAALTPSAELLNTLCVARAVMANLPELPGYNGSILTVDDVEAGNIVSSLEAVIALFEAAPAAPDHPSREGPSDAEMRAGSICQPDGLMFDAFGNPRTRAVRVTLDGTHLICRPSEVEMNLDGEDRSQFVITDVYLSDQEIDRLPEFEGW